MRTTQSKTSQETITKEKVFEVQEIEIAILKTNPPIPLVNAKGTTSTSGWENAELVPYVYIQAPPDGIYDFDFVAEPPSGIVSQAIAPIKANYNFESMVDGFKGVRIHTSTNTLVAMLDKNLGS